MSTKTKKIQKREQLGMDEPIDTKLQWTPLFDQVLEEQRVQRSADLVGHKWDPVTRVCECGKEVGVVLDDQTVEEHLIEVDPKLQQDWVTIDKDGTLWRHSSATDTFQPIQTDLPAREGRSVPMPANVFSSTYPELYELYLEAVTA